MRLNSAIATTPGGLSRTDVANVDIAGRRRRFRFVIVLFALAVAVGGVLAWRGVGGWEDVLVWLMQIQQALHQQLAGALQAVATGGAAATASLLGLSLMYGVFHAAGPGHGKAVITTYLGTHAVQLRRGVVLSVLSALAQGLVAIALVEALEASAAIFGMSLRRAQSLGMQVENLGFALIAVLGAVLAGRSMLALWRHRRHARTTATPIGGLLSANGRAMQPYCGQCARQHGPSRAQLYQPLSWRTSAGIVLAIGLRPCTGAVLVMLFAHTLGLRWTAMASVLAMSLGTAATVATLAVLAVSARQAAFKLLARVNRSGTCLGLLFHLLGVAGGLLILAIGASLLQQGLGSRVHPLL